MTARPELPDSIWVGDTQYLPVNESQAHQCQDCGRPVEVDRDGQPFRICGSCYNAYVENAGR
jgi:ribosomal protein L37AE/L43A